MSDGLYCFPFREKYFPHLDKHFEEITVGVAAALNLVCLTDLFVGLCLDRIFAKRQKYLLEQKESGIKYHFLNGSSLPFSNFVQEHNCTHLLQGVAVDYFPCCNQGKESHAFG